MNKNLGVFWMACICACLLVGCDGKNRIVDSRQHGAKRNAQPAIASKLDLQRILIPGMATNEIVASLGEPRWVEIVDQGEQVWDFGLHPFPENSESHVAYVTYVIGVTIGITNGHMAYWGCISGGVPTDRLLRTEDIRPTGKAQADSPQLKFFIVSADPIANGRFIDTERLPKLGFVCPTPVLTIRVLKELTLEERTIPGTKNQESTRWAFNVSLTQEDAERLKAMTATNVSEKILIMVGDEPVIAPTVLAPLETGRFAIECSERSLMELVKKHLAEMKQQSK